MRIDHRPWSCRDNRAHYLNITTMTWEDGGYSIKTWPGALEGENLTIIPRYRASEKYYKQDAHVQPQASSPGVLGTRTTPREKTRRCRCISDEARDEDPVDTSISSRRVGSSSGFVYPTRSRRVRELVRVNARQLSCAQGWRVEDGEDTHRTNVLPRHPPPHAGASIKTSLGFVARRLSRACEARY